MIGKKEIRIQIFKVSGGDGYQVLGDQYIKNFADGHLVVYDVTDRRSFEYDIPKRLVRIRKNTSSDKKPIILLVGNKIDLEDQRKISIS